MEEKTAHGEGNLPHIRLQPPGFAEADREDRTGELRIAHLHSQVWRDSLGGDHSTQAFTHFEDVPRADVLIGPRRRGWGSNRCGAPPPGIFLLPLLLAFLPFSVCHPGQRASLKKGSQKPRLKFRQGLTDEPLQLAERGYEDSEAYPDLNW